MEMNRSSSKNVYCYSLAMIHFVFVGNQDKKSAPGGRTIFSEPNINWGRACGGRLWDGYIGETILIQYFTSVFPHNEDICA